jgi:hypothetical protein
MGPDIKAAEAYNKPGQFSAFALIRVDLEHRWQQPAPRRCVSRGGDKASRVQAYTTIRPVGSDDPRTCGNTCKPMRRKPGGRFCYRA